MKYTLNRNENELTVSISGKLDTITSPELETKLNESLNGVEKLIFDFDALSYISSAGLRVVLGAWQIMQKQSGDMVIRNANNEVMAVFEVTGFDSDFKFE